MALSTPVKAGTLLAVLAAGAVTVASLMGSGPADAPEQGPAHAPLPSPGQIAALPPDGGEEFNRLLHEQSPYLLQHARNPVDWYPWGDEAFARARQEDKPVFLSVGYSTCHWCHVMERESFSREDVAAILNEGFIAIKVDREERPDVDRLYMHATTLLTGQGGWPNSVWLTPDGRPWFAGTYFPREDRGDLPGFKTVLRALSEVWKERRQEVEEQADVLARAIEELGAAPAAGGGELSPELARRALARLQAAFDAEHGGFGGAPKFPAHGALALLMARHRRTGDRSLLDMTTRTLDAMARGGIRDHVGGGFHRYSTDRRWLLPHFEKMLYDNALLGRAYVDACLLTGDARFRRVADEIYGWVAREMTDPGGGFYSALDADSEGEEGRFYVWTREQILDALGQAEGELFCRVYNVEPEGNFRDEATGSRSGANVLHLSAPLDETARSLETAPEALRRRLGRSLDLLRERREKRPRPHLDDKVLTAWNGLMIGSLAHAGRALEHPPYTAAAANAADFILETMRADGRLLRTWRNGEARLNAYLEDYVFLAEGLLDLHHATGEGRYLEEARALMDHVLERFADDRAGGFFTTSEDHAELLVRLKTSLDSALPSPNGKAAQVLVRLAALTGERRYLDAAGETLRAFAGVMEEMPRASQSLVLGCAMYLEAVEAGEALGPAPDARSRAARVTLELFASRLRVRPGGRVLFALRVAVDDGWHINSNAPLQDYLIPTAVTLGETPGASLDGAAYPEGALVEFAFSPEALSVYEGEVWVELPVAVDEGAAPGRLPLRFEVQTQACNDRVCLPPEKQELSVILDVDPDGPTDEPRHPSVFAGRGAGP